MQNVVNGITTTDMTVTAFVSNAQDEPADDILPNLVSNAVQTTTEHLEAKTTEDEDDAVKELLQLSKSTDVIPEEDVELPIGTLLVDAAPVLIALGNQDVLNAIENIKKNEAGADNTSKRNNSKTDVQNNTNTEVIKEKEKENDKKTGNAETPPTSLNKGSLVIVKHGIKIKRSSGLTYRCSQCSKWKKSMHKLNKHYHLKHKPQMCWICNKLFDFLGTLKKHMYSHLDKPYKCDNLC